MRHGLVGVASVMVSLLLAADTDEEGIGTYRNVDGLHLQVFLCYHFHLLLMFAFSFITSTFITSPSPASSISLALSFLCDNMYPRMWPAHS